MFVILTYDVGAKRNSKVLKECRKYLVHVQKSVFEGHVTEKQLLKIKNVLAGIIDKEQDQVAIYKIHRNGVVEKEILGCHVSYDNIL